MAHLDRFFGVRERGGVKTASDDGARVMNDGVYTIPRITASACQYGGEYPYCDPKPIEWDTRGPPKENQVCYTDCGGGPTTGGEEPEPPAEPEPEPCATSDSVLNSTRVQTGFAQLWDASQASSPHENRREAAGFIVRNADGSFSFQHLSSTAGIVSDPCRIRVTNVVVPPNVVGWVHTHPYGRGDTMEACGGRRYVRGASEEDVSTVKQLTTLRGREIAGYILDKDGIMTYSTSTRKNRYDEFTRRCGY